MPEPSNDKINMQEDPKYRNGANAKSEDNAPFRGELHTVSDQQDQRNRRLRRAAKIRSGNFLETATEEEKGRQW